MRFCIFHVVARPSNVVQGPLDVGKEFNMDSHMAEGEDSLSPSELLRRRKPELFSDSYSLSDPQLTKEVLEYHIDSITSRNEDQKFEHFARRLLEKEVCPNLVPQTGPTGGGD